MALGKRLVLAAAAPAAFAMPFMPQACSPTSNGNIDNSTIQILGGGHALVVTPDLQFFRDAGEPIIYGFGSCTVGGVTRFRQTVQSNVNEMRQGQTLNATCEGGWAPGSTGIHSSRS